MPIEELRKECRLLANQAYPDPRKRLEYLRAFRSFTADLIEQGADVELEEWLLEEKAHLIKLAAEVRRERRVDNVIKIARVAIPAAAATGLIDLIKP